MSLATPKGGDKLSKLSYSGDILSLIANEAEKCLSSYVNADDNVQDAQDVQDVDADVDADVDNVDNVDADL